MLQLTYELRPKWYKKKKKKKSQNAVSRSDPLQGSDKKLKEKHVCTYNVHVVLDYEAVKTVKYAKNLFFLVLVPKLGSDQN